MGVMGGGTERMGWTNVILKYGPSKIRNTRL